MRLGPVHTRLLRWPPALLIGLATAPLLAAPQWGSRPYAQEKREYLAQVKQLERQANQLLSRIRQIENDTEAYLGGFSSGSRQQLEQEYERHADNHNRRERHFRAQLKERQAKALYEDARAAFSPAQEKQPEIRANLWTKNIDWRRRRIETRQARLRWVDSRLVVLQGLAGFDWEAFWADNAEDVLYVYKETAARTLEDFLTCLHDIPSREVGRYLGALTGPTALVAEPPPTVGSLLANVAEDCVIGTGLKALVNAFEAAWKKQFLDRMRARGVLDGVSEYWWDEIISAKLPADLALQKGVTAYVSDQTQKSTGQSYSSWVSQVSTANLAQQELPGLQDRYAAMAAAARTPAQRADVTGKMMSDAQSRAKVRMKDLARSAKLAVDYTQKAAELYVNSQTFADIENREVERYERVVACLTARGDVVDAPSVVAVLRHDAGGYTRFLSDCRAQPGQQVDLVRIGQILERLHALLSSTQSRVAQAEADCASARTGLTTAEGLLAELEGRLQALEPGPTAQSPVGDALARAQQYEREAYEAAARVVEAKQAVETSQSQACAAADRIAMATGASEHAQWLVAAASAAGEASVRQRLAADHAMRARAAAERAAALVPGAENAAVAPTLLGELEAGLSAAGQDLAQVQQAAQQVQAASTELTQARSETDGLLGEARRILGPVSAQPERARQLAEAEGLYAQMQGIGAGLAACSADLASLTALQSHLAELRSRLEALQTPGSAPAGAHDPALLEAVANARASADTAEVFAEGTAAIAQQAMACRDRAEAGARVQPPPPPPPAADPAGAGGGWTVGDVRTESAPTPASPPPPQAGAADVASFINASASAAAACRYPEAVNHANQAAARAPNHPWVVANHDKLRRLAERQRVAVAAMNQSQAALNAKDYDAAGRQAEIVQREAPRCMDGLVEGLVGTINSAARADLPNQWRPRGNDQGREAAGDLLPTLVDMMNDMIKAQNPKARGGGTGGGGTARTTPPASDPCATKATTRNAWTPPRCDCAGYRWNGYKCVRDPSVTVPPRPTNSRPPSGGGTPTTQPSTGSGSSSGVADDRPPCTCRDKEGTPYRRFFGLTDCLVPPPEHRYSTAAADYNCKP